MTDPDLAEMLAEFTKDCRALLEHAEEAQKHFSEGNIDALKQIVSISHYKISQIGTDRTGILAHLGMQ